MNKEQLQKYVDKIKMELGDELNKFYSKDKELINTQQILGQYQEGFKRLKMLNFLEAFSRNEIMC